MKARPEERVGLVSHGGFLHWFTEDWTGFNENAGEHSVSVTWISREDGGADEKWSGTGWKNVEHRTFEFKEGSDSLVETEQSREARRGTERDLGLSENTQLGIVVEKTSEANGKPIVAKV